MKRLGAFLLLLLSAPCFAQLQFNQLPPAGPVGPTDVVPIQQGGVTSQTTQAGLLAVLPSGTTTAAGGTVLGSSDSGTFSGKTITSAANTLTIDCNVSTCSNFPGGASGANPTGTVGLSIVNGSAATFMRSDAAPPLSQSITPLWTGLHKYTLGDFALLGSSTGYTLLESSLSGSSNNTLTLPTTASDTLAALGTAQTWTGAQTFPSGDLLHEGSSTGTNALNSLNTGATNYTNGIPAANGNLGIVLAQSGLPFVLPGNGHMDATGNVVLGANPPTGATMYLSSSTAGSGITITFNAATLTGTAAGDTGRQITVSDGAGVYRTFNITGNSGTSTTIAQGTLNQTLTTACSSGAPCAITKVWVTGPVFTATNTAGAGGVTYTAPLDVTYASGYWYFPASAPIGTAGFYYCTMTSPNLSVATCYNNAYSSGTPTIPGSPTAFSGLTAAAYTQTTGTNILGPNVSVPANAMGVNGRVELQGLLSFNNSSNYKQLNGAFGGSVNGNVYQNTQLSIGFIGSIQNRGATGAQVLGGNGNGDLNNGSIPKFLAIDTTSAQTVAFYLQMSTATDIETAESYSFKLFPN